MYILFSIFLDRFQCHPLTGICPTRRQQKHLLCCFFGSFLMNFSPSFLPAPCSTSPRPRRRDGDGESTHCSGGGRFSVSTTRGVCFSLLETHPASYFSFKKNNKSNSHGKFLPILIGIWCKAMRSHCLAETHS